MIAKSLKMAISGYYDNIYYSKIAGVSVTELASIKNGGRSVSLDKAIQIAKAYDRVEDLIKFLSDEIREQSEKYNRG